MHRKLATLMILLTGGLASIRAQVNPKILKDPNKNLPVTPILKNMVLINSNFYIQDERFWAAVSRGGKVVTDDCVSNDNRYRWGSATNADGTITISSVSDNTLKLVYKDSRIMFQGERRGEIGFFAEPVSGGSGASRYINKWYLQKISGQQHWLRSSDRRDSFMVKIIPVAEIPFNAVAFDFNTLTGWNIAEGPAASHAFSGQPSSINFIPFYNSPVIPAMPLGGSYWKELEDRYFAFDTKTTLRHINTSRPGDNRWARPNESNTGAITSHPFFLCGDNMSFRIGGTEDATNIKIELLQKLPAPEAGSVSFADGPYRLITNTRTTGHNNDITRVVHVNVSSLKYSVCRIRITDNSTTGHIILDQISFGGPRNPGLIAEPRPADPALPSTGKPIWGAIDMHTHPISYLGMGGKLMHGRLDGDPNVALGNCNCTHGGWGTDNTCGNYFRAEIVNLIDEHYNKTARRRLEDIQVPHNDHPHGGFPGLTDWPAQNTMTHQQMWYEWLRRARDGGLKSIIALTVNSEVLGRALGGDAPYDDKTTSDRQIDELIAFVRRNRDFLDTVTSSARMRQVVNEGKMAVIIGMEIDNIGNFYQNVNVTTDQIRNEITRLKNKGVRYIFPIHVTDNKFGGAAVYKELFNFSNKYATGQPITGTIPVELWPPVLPGNLFNVESAPDRNITFRLESGIMASMTRMRPLVELVELGGFPVLPPPLDIPSLAIKPVVDPIILALRLSQQYQLAKKIFLDRNPELSRYDRIVRSPTDPGGHRNVLGLSELGVFAVTEMMRQGLMIDIDHASEKSVNDMLRIASGNDYPVNSGHNGLRGTSDNEKTRTRGQLDTISRLGGMFGIGWELQNPTQFSNNFTAHLSAMGGKNTTFGSDIGGYAATTVKPASPAKFINYTNRALPDFLTTASMAGTSRTWNYNTDGMAHIGLYPDFFQALKKDGMNMSAINQLFLASEYFAQMWEKCERRAPLIPR